MFPGPSATPPITSAGTTPATSTRPASYYEWWYVDCSFDNGYHMVLTFHYRNHFMNPIIPTTQLMIYHPDGGKQTARFAMWKPEET